MFLVDVAFDQPWFDPVRLLQPDEEIALSEYFTALEEDVSRAMRADTGMQERELTTGLVRSLIGLDSLAKRELEARLRQTHVALDITARELRARPAVSGELLDLVVELKIVSPAGHEWLHRLLVVECKRLYAIRGVFTLYSQFKELNRVETLSNGTKHVRSAIQAKSMIQLHPRSGAFLLYAPVDVSGSTVGVRVLHPETVFLLPCQPTLKQVLEDTISFRSYMLDHFFTGRRGVDPAEVPLLRDGENAMRYHCRFTLVLPDDRGADSIPGPRSRA